MARWLPVDDSLGTEEDRGVVDHRKHAEIAEQRAQIADERAIRASARADEAREEARLASTDAARRRFLREAELHLDAAAAMRGAASLQREHAEHERAAAQRATG
jgi:hypothetical protein